MTRESSERYNVHPLSLKDNQQLFFKTNQSPYLLGTMWACYCVPSPPCDQHMSEYSKTWLIPTVHRGCILSQLSTQQESFFLRNYPCLLSIHTDSSLHLHSLGPQGYRGCSGSEGPRSAYGSTAGVNCSPTTPTIRHDE